MPKQKPENTRRTTIRNVALNGGEHRLIERAASAMSTPVSTYIRSAALRQAERDLKK